MRGKNTITDGTVGPARDEPDAHYLYWLEEREFENARILLPRHGFTLDPVRLTPCQVLKARGKRVVYAPPKVWNGMCNRQGSWYRASRRAGQYMLMSTVRLPGLERFLDAEMSLSDFLPAALPGRDALQELVASEAYETAKPEDWERVTFTESVFLKVFFTVTRMWRRGDNLRKHWLGHRANHANFLARRFTTVRDGEDVPYSVTENASVCSSCAEFFNLIAPADRKLVRACPGSISISGARRDAYYDVRPCARTRGET